MESKLKNAKKLCNKKNANSRPNDSIQRDFVFKRNGKPISSQILKIRKVFSRLNRELSEEELATPGVQKMLVAYLEQVVAENTENREFQQKFYKKDKELAVAKEKQKNWLTMEIISTGCIAVGAAALVFVPEAWKTQPNGWIALVLGSLVTLIGIAAKAIRLLRH